MSRLAVTLFILATVSAVHAQSGAGTLSPKPASTEGSKIGSKSPAVAGWLSGGVTLVGVAAMSVGVMEKGSGLEAKAAAFTGLGVAAIGPSLGQIYAGNTWNTGLKVRLAGVAAFGAVMFPTAYYCDGGTACGIIPGLIATIVGGSLFVGGSLYEIATAPRAARRYNRRASQTQVSILPVAAGPTAGISLAGAF